MTAIAGTAEVLLRTEGLSVARGRREVVHGVDIALARGEVVALLGPNGAGKSTLLDALGGGLTPVRGDVRRHGRVAIALQAAELARRSALDNVILALAWWDVPRPERAERAREALAALGASHLADRRADALSGGERRRVHIARVLALRPDILLLDEPFAGLDAEARGRLLADAASALRSPARATLIVVHDRAEAWALADRMLIMLDGRIVAAGAPRELLDEPPSPEVARFLGFDGELREGSAIVLTRPAHVELDPRGPLRATVVGAVALEDGVRLALELTDGRGRLGCIASLAAPRVGDEVGVRVVGGARFAEGA
ncbi:MAG: ABC transporter ATP-binding protein [Solirubrobacterales bacterium]|nr:ABC transporter ATP-binding protein [Solirubrobacterales bacterium]